MRSHSKDPASLLPSDEKYFLKKTQLHAPPVLTWPYHNIIRVRNALQHSHWGHLFHRPVLTRAMLYLVFESLAARSKFTGWSKSLFGRSAAQKLLKHVTLTLSEASPGSDPGDPTSGSTVIGLGGNSVFRSVWIYKLDMEMVGGA
jgi:hypothetical protein